jgi:peptidoglycan/LPS O-acetylase OafA/YrhL
VKKNIPRQWSIWLVKIKMNPTWILLSLLFGVVISWLTKGEITPLLFGGKIFDHRSLLVKFGILIFLTVFASGFLYLIFYGLNSLFRSNFPRTLNDTSQANITPGSNSKQLPHPKYRPDIDGLRAIAVLSVVGFHAFPDKVKGGFIGVDIFFVISGFLISTIILGNLERDTFSFIEFYNRRIRRIFPALLVMLVASIAFGWFRLNSNEYQQLGKHIAGGAGFVSNFIFWGESGYFDSTAESKPLLHLWSLGVEEQYYIVWPFLLWLSWKIWKNKFSFLATTIALLVISFGLNISKVDTNPSAVFYSPQTRFWELLVGAVLAHITLYEQNIFDKVKKKLDSWFCLKANGNTLHSVQSVLGVVLIVLGLLVITDEMLFPGWWALLPTLGTMLIISAGAQAWLNRVVLSNYVLVWFGLISYPLYLWHWPVLSFANILEVETLSIEITIVAVLISVVLAWLTYRLIEEPIRFGSKSNAKALSLLILMSLVGSSGYAVYTNQGFQGYGYRVVDKIDFENYFENSLPNWNYFKTIGLMSKFRYDCDFFDSSSHRLGNTTRIPLPFSHIDKSCYTRDPHKKNVLYIWGDSHAQQLYYGLNNNLPHDWQILIGASSGCIAYPDVQEDSTIDWCQRSNWFSIKTIKETKPDVVIVAQEKGFTVERIDQLADLLLESGVGKVIILGPVPQWKENLPNIILRDLWDNTPERTFIGINEDIMNENSYLRTHFPNREDLNFVDVIGFFCNESGCLIRIGNNKQTGITTWDVGHMTPIASDYLAKNLLVKLIVEDSKTSK